MGDIFFIPNHVEEFSQQERIKLAKEIFGEDDDTIEICLEYENGEGGLNDIVTKWKHQLNITQHLTRDRLFLPYIRQKPGILFFPGEKHVFFNGEDFGVIIHRVDLDRLLNDSEMKTQFSLELN